MAVDRDHDSRGLIMAALRNKAGHYIFVLQGKNIYGLPIT